MLRSDDLHREPFLQQRCTSPVFHHVCDQHLVITDVDPVRSSQRGISDGDCKEAHSVDQYFTGLSGLPRFTISSPRLMHEWSPRGCSLDLLLPSLRYRAIFILLHFFCLYMRNYDSLAEPRGG